MKSRSGINFNVSRNEVNDSDKYDYVLHVSSRSKRGLTGKQQKNDNIDHIIPHVVFSFFMFFDLQKQQLDIHVSKQNLLLVLENNLICVAGSHCDYYQTRQYLCRQQVGLGPGTGLVFVCLGAGTGIVFVWLGPGTGLALVWLDLLEPPRPGRSMTPLRPLLEHRYYLWLELVYG